MAVRSWRFASALLVIFLLAGYSPEHHWDEYFYLYSAAHHPVGRLLGFEPVLADGLFPNGFFSGKLGFVALLRGLMAVVGTSWPSVAVVRVVFALLCVMAAWAVAGLARSLFPERRLDGRVVAAAALASPIALYLAFKTLSEVPSLLLGTCGCWAFAAALTPPRPSSEPPGDSSPGRLALLAVRAPTLLLCVVALSAATLTRVSAPLGFVSFAAALPLLGDRRFTVRRAWGWAAAVLLGHALVVAAVYAGMGISPDRLQALADSVTGRTQGAAIAVYALGLTIQMWGLVGAIGLAWPLPPAQRLALGWLALGILPYLLSASYLEPRFFYLTLPPAALLVHDGLVRLARWTAVRALPLMLSALAVVTVVDRALLVPLMTFELDERAYAHTMTALEERYPGGTVLVPWLSDFCYLRLSRPGPFVALAFSRTYGTGRVFSSPAFLEWLGDRRYVGTPEALTAQPRPWTYVGWTYNPSVVRVSDRLSALGVRSMRSPDQMGLLNHLTASWLWSSPQFRLSPIAIDGPYQAFLVTPSADAER